MKLTQLYILMFITTSTFSQNTEEFISKLLDYESEGIQLKKSFEEEDELDEYLFEISPNSNIKATGKDKFFQFKNKRKKKMKSMERNPFFLFVDIALSEMNFTKIFSDKEERIVTYHNDESYNESYLELYYEDDRLSLIEITYLRKFGKGDFFNVDSIYSINSVNIDYKKYELDENTIDQMISEHNSSIKNQLSEDLIEKDSIVARYNIAFNISKLSFTKESMEYIANMAAIIKGNPSRKYIIAGNTSSDGSRFLNYELSKNRAEYICKILINYYDISKDQLFYKGNGEQYLLHENANDTTRILNRRVDLLNYQEYRSKRIRK